MVSVAAAEAEFSELFDAIGLFLANHGLSPDPAHYTFAHQVLRDPDGPLAQAVLRITDGGLRLTQRDISMMGGVVVPGPPVGTRGVRAPSAHPDPDGETANDPVRQADMLIARAELQVSGFSDAVRFMHAETSGFGRDLVASAAAIRAVDPVTGIDEITRLTGAMINRIHSAECRLADAKRETEELRAALDEARGCARLDPLTELPNRRAFDEAWDALAPGKPVVIAVCDIDHFKRVNDEFGHAVGDRVLRAIGRTLADEIEGALVARYGGEEFAFLMTDVEPEAAFAEVDRARSAVAARRFRSRDTDMPIGTVTISGGVAAGTAADLRELLYAKADAALYRAKAAGRNRVFRAA